MEDILKSIQNKAPYLDGYEDIIAQPMDLPTIEKKLHSDQYKTFEEFSDDVRLVFSNCIQFNQIDSAFEIRAMANTLKHYFETVVAAITGQPRRKQRVYVKKRYGCMCAFYEVKEVDCIEHHERKKKKKFLLC